MSTPNYMKVVHLSSKKPFDQEFYERVLNNMRENARKRWEKKKGKGENNKNSRA